jgi:hypothetical protein
MRNYDILRRWVGGGDGRARAEVGRSADCSFGTIKLQNITGNSEVIASKKKTARQR